MEDDEPKEFEQKTSKYQAGIAALIRLDFLWKDCNTHARAIQYARWNEDLDRVWMELEADAKEEEKNKFKSIDDKIIELGLYSSPAKLQKSNPELYNKLIFTQKKTLMEKEVFIRRVQNRQGKGTAYMDDLDEYMD
ncbi:hypothetical protein M0R04_14510 [Candidatus Dojkabacteria bacterium]|jgi:hypothetical protein|nr:hypothetical protein [Candidatus Dojkabacteria bacterium]